jgi:hypothetical protein
MPALVLWADPAVVVIGGTSYFLPPYRPLIFSSKIRPLEEIMKKLLLSVAVVAFTGTSAFAQTSEYYVVRDTTTKKCTIVDKKPTTTTTTVVDNGIFKTRAEAETGMRTMKVCTEN